ncbi:copper radical oxidase [Colletotrichum plurivorum]|uniref:Copper radical oxidase n=1 Tax=Colletotrichum plurivorum TaxID=2175906 RepID=A0A8H6J3B1_9PEZI|nr:copper radical oxidase [Colletotrichum plurivorum]
MSLSSLSKFGLLAMPIMAPLVSAAAVFHHGTSALSVRVVSNIPTYQPYLSYSGSGSNCYREPPAHEGRALKGKTTSSDSEMTADFCASFCREFKYFGTEFSRECFCGNEIALNTPPVDATDCSMTCTGQADQSCGAADRLNIYQNSDYQAPSIATVSGRTYRGCLTEPHGGRAMSDKSTTQDNMTPEQCSSFCTGYNFAGLEYGSECWCSNIIVDGIWADDFKCSKLCSGDSKYFCGDGDQLTVYGPALAQAVVPQAQHQYCVKDDQVHRVLEASRTASEDMTAQKCSDFCVDYTFFGVEFGKECYCGDVLPGGTQQVDNSECATPCFGDGKFTCGAPGRMNLYKSTKPVTILQSVDNYSFTHCVVDNPTQRVLDEARTSGPDMTAQKCKDFCSARSFRYFGLEFGEECFCGNSYTAQDAADEECNKKCGGDRSHLCGAADRLAVYDSDNQALVPF